MNKPRYKCHNSSKLKNEFSWTEEVPESSNEARCTLCGKIFILSNSAKTSCISHAKSIDHKAKVATIENSKPVSLFFRSSSLLNLNFSQREENYYQLVKDSATVSAKNSQIKSFLIEDEVVEKEILLIINNVLRHHSLRDLESALPVLEFALTVNFLIN